MAAKNKHLEKAEKLLQKGKHEAALDEFLIAREEERDNDAIILAIADTYQLLNRPRERRQCFEFLFDKYAEKGDSSKTLDFFQRLQKLGPIEPKRMITGAHLLEKQKPQEAIDLYNQALEALGTNVPEASLTCLDGLARLQPSSLELQQRIAEAAIKRDNLPRAASAYQRMGELLASDKKFPEAAEALEKSYRASGESSEARVALAAASGLAHRFSRVIELLEKPGEAPGDSSSLSLLAEAYYAEKRMPEAEAAYWQLAAGNPDAFDYLIEIALQYVRQQNFSKALPLLQKLEEELPAAKQQNRLISLAEKLGRLELSDIEGLEFLSRLADKLHLDAPLSVSQHRLFDLYFAAGEFHKAAGALERLIDVDPYAPECTAKLRQMEGKSDPAVWRDMASRLGQTGTRPKAPAVTATPEPGASKPAASDTGGSALGDLILQAEIFLQYNLHDKARERLERIAKLFPGEEVRNGDLRALFEKAGFVPHFAPAREKIAAVRTLDKQADWNVISEVIRNLSRQGSVKGVLSAAVNDIGRLWQASRCVIGLVTPNHPPTMALEYISQGTKPSDAPLLGKLVMRLQKITEEQGSSLIAEDVGTVRQLQPLKALLAALRVQSLVAVPLREDDQPSGILVLEQCGAERSWKTNDVAALQTIADQIILAISNARLRSLMKTLAVTDERSGLLHRESYISCLLTEAERMRKQKTPLAAAILDFSEPGLSQSAQREETVRQFMQQFRVTFTSHLRQNDIPLQYGPYSLAVIMPATDAKQAALMVEKMRKLSVSVSTPSADRAPTMAAGIAEAVTDSEMDSTDTVTELINRLETALDDAHIAGSNATKILEAPSLSQ